MVVFKAISSTDILLLKAMKLRIQVYQPNIDFDIVDHRETKLFGSDGVQLTDFRAKVLHP